MGNRTINCEINAMIIITFFSHWWVLLEIRNASIWDMPLSGGRSEIVKLYRSAKLSVLFWRLIRQFFGCS